MWRDPIVDEVRQARQAYAERFNFDLNLILQDLRRRQSESGRVLVNRSTVANSDTNKVPHPKTSPRPSR